MYQGEVVALVVVQEVNSAPLEVGIHPIVALGSHALRARAKKPIRRPQKGKGRMGSRSQEEVERVRPTVWEPLALCRNEEGEKMAW